MQLVRSYLGNNAPKGLKVLFSEKASCAAKRIEVWKKDDGEQFAILKGTRLIEYISISNCVGKFANMAGEGNSPLSSALFISNLA